VNSKLLAHVRSFNYSTSKLLCHPAETGNARFGSFGQFFGILVKNGPFGLFFLTFSESAKNFIQKTVIHVFFGMT